MKLKMILTTAALSLGSLVGSAHAQQVATVKPVQWGYYNNYYDDHEEREYRHGYRDGQHSGRDDARHGRGFLLYDHGPYRDHHDREYREGFERGYRESYRSNAYWRGDRYNEYRWRDRDRDWDGYRRW